MTQIKFSWSIGDGQPDVTLTLPVQEDTKFKSLIPEWKRHVEKEGFDPSVVFSFERVGGRLSQEDLVVPLCQDIRVKGNAIQVIDCGSNPDDVRGDRHDRIHFLWLNTGHKITKSFDIDRETSLGDLVREWLRYVEQQGFDNSVDFVFSLTLPSLSGGPGGAPLDMNYRFHPGFTTYVVVMGEAKLLLPPAAADDHVEVRDMEANRF